MTRKAVWTAAFVVLLSNTVALGFAWTNRKGEPEAEVTLTERELRVAPHEAGNTAMVMVLAWIDPSGGPEGTRWLDASRLVSLGFDCSAPLTFENASFYRGQLPRSAYAALEYEGESWNRYLASLGDVPRERAMAGSHLVLIDVGLDPSALRARHPDRHRVVITRASVHLAFREVPGRRLVVFGRVTQAYPGELSVPKPLRPALALTGVPARGTPAFDPEQRWRGVPLAGAPRYRATVKWGASLEPWLDELQTIATTLGG